MMCCLCFSEMMCLFVFLRDDVFVCVSQRLCVCLCFSEMMCLFVFLRDDVFVCVSQR